MGLRISLGDKWHGFQNGSQKATRMKTKGPGVVAQLVESLLGTLTMPWAPSLAPHELGMGIHIHNSSTGELKVAMSKL